MDTDDRRMKPATPRVRFQSEHPNFPEVSGTTLPLLATVLAGFAVTIIVQLVLRPDTSEGFPTLVTISIIAFLLSTLFFLSSTFFAVNAQSNNYLHFLQLDDTATELLRVDDRAGWIETLERRWYIYHRAALVSFYGGIALLLAAMGVMLWEYTGALIASIFAFAVVLSFGMNVWIGLHADRVGQTG